ncbi:predicted protein [Sclerotinia sclerotiorum 1980 UF-70]|uniref:Uncharacterized protein n=1 Tax=Sclerotinia sclerotiorum (strain ATCC 18683 / 1980 / Ss-1) TaxID=665079 RepID=A7EMP0_SCLS1|nr:predicted protein [Sclerotinia sclerotiorum 1980 UF-70]EDO04106.1 predicted protein [Sclerotinia sclerotiorum 1980 UF-70]
MIFDAIAETCLACRVTRGATVIGRLYRDSIMSMNHTNKVSNGDTSNWKFSSDLGNGSMASSSLLVVQDSRMEYST